MLLNDNEQQLSEESFHDESIDLNSVLIRRDEFSEIIANMTKTLHLNTPEQTSNGLDMDEFNENKFSSKEVLIEQLQTQLIRDQMQRKQVRDYARILRDSNTPAPWYQTSSTNRSIYFYDPTYQKYIQQQSNPSLKTTSNMRPIYTRLSHKQEHGFNNSTFVQNSPFTMTPRIKYMLDICNTTVNHHKQKQHLNHHYRPTSLNTAQKHVSSSFQLQSIPTLPSINGSRQRNRQTSNLFNKNLKTQQPILTESRKKI